MAKGKTWTSSDISRLKEMVKNTSNRQQLIMDASKEFDRTTASIEGKLYSMGISKAKHAVLSNKQNTVNAASVQMHINGTPHAAKIIAKTERLLVAQHKDITVTIEL